MYENKKKIIYNTTTKIQFELIIIQLFVKFVALVFAVSNDDLKCGYTKKRRIVYLAQKNIFE
jgi:hypothetical protein